MGGLEDIFGRRERPATAVGLIHAAYAGVFATSPEVVADDAFVTIDGIDGGVSRFGPATWVPRVDDAGVTVYPVRGDVCLVVFDDAGDPWVAAWKES